MAGSQQELLETFLRLGFISPDALKRLQELASRKSVPPLEACLVSGEVHPDARAWALADCFGLPFLEIDPRSVPLELGDIVPEAVAREHMVAPVAREDGRLTLAASDPFGYRAFTGIEELSGLSVRLVVCPRRTIVDLIERFYPDPEQLPAADVHGAGIAREEAEEWLCRGRGKRLAEKILLRASAAGMSSVRVLPARNSALVTGRGPDGSVALLSCPVGRRGPLVEAFRAAAGLSGPGCERHEAVFHIDSAAGVKSFRANFLPGISGPEVVVKILPDRQSSIALDYLGLAADQLDVTRRVLAKRDGICLFSSPGHEGVGSTLFAILGEIYRPGRRVVTVEEQFRFRTERYIQLERRDAEERFGGSWARLAESLDPHVLMIDHVADRAEIEELVLIAQSGAFVLCAVRTFDIEETLRILLGAGTDPFILARAGRLVMHQRLVRLLCPDCRRKVPARPSLRGLNDKAREALEPIVAEAPLYVPGGCARCQESGYAGKMALCELLPFTPAVQAVVSSSGPLSDKIESLVRDDLHSSALPAQDLLRRGMVTYDDVLPFFR